MALPSSKPAGPVPETALAFFNAKGLKPAFSYLDVWAEEHLAAFTAAKIMEADALDAIRQATAKALAEGTTFETFRRDLQNQLTALGWWGERVVTDPVTGVQEVVNINPRRLELIYDTNLRTARAAGQWDRIERTKRLRPYLQYYIGPSRVHREQHEAWNGLILPVDHEFWTSAFPPNGWGCRCSVRHITAKEADRLGGPRKDFKYDWIESKNKRTGKVVRHIDGVHPSFSYSFSDRFGGLRSTLAETVAETSPGPAKERLKEVEVPPPPPDPRIALRKALADGLGQIDVDGGKAARDALRQAAERNGIVHRTAHDGYPSLPYVDKIVLVPPSEDRWVRGNYYPTDGRISSNDDEPSLAIRALTSDTPDKVALDSMRFLLHESIHNTTPFRPKDYSKPGNKVIEELTTEISARIVARDLFGGGSFAKTSLGQPYIEIFEPKPGLKVSKWLDRSTSYSYLVEAVAEILQKETGWDEARVQLEIDAASLAVRSVPQDAPIPADAVKFFVSKTTATAEQKSKIAEAIQEFSKIEEP